MPIMPSRKLHVEVLRLRDHGWVLPRFRLALLRPKPGLLLLDEIEVKALNRHARVARLIDAEAQIPFDQIPPLIDATFLRMTVDEWVLTGTERLPDGLREIDYTQSWLVTPVELRVQPDWEPGDAGDKTQQIAAENA